MCATFNVDKTTVSKYLSELAEDLDMRDGGDVFPSDKAVILTAARPTACTWGFTRYDKKGVLINARAETVTQKPMFAPSFYARRCAVPANGFYEWDSEKRRRYFVRADGAPLFLCGFYRVENGENRFIVLTKQATSPVSEYHDRIPIIAEEEQAKIYLRDYDYARSILCEPASVLLRLA